MSLRCKVCGEHLFRSAVDSDDDRCARCVHRDEIRGDGGPPEWQAGRLACYAGRPRVANPYDDGDGLDPLALAHLWYGGWDFENENV